MASGIQEHNEARRKERVIMKRANWEKKLKAEAPLDMPQVSHDRNHSDSNTYDLELTSRRVGSPPGIGGRDARSVDQQRRMDHYKQEQKQYTAKIPNRYKNFDYMAQW